MKAPHDKRLAYIAAGLLTQTEARALVDDLKDEFDLAVVEEMFRAFRSATVAAIESRADDMELYEWSSVIRHAIAALGRGFSGWAERYQTLRFMLSEASDRAAMGKSEDHERPGMKSLLALLAGSAEGMTLPEIESETGDAPYAIAQRLRMALASGTVELGGNWRQRRFIVTGRLPEAREEYPPRAEVVR